jgi:hypothetical protein
LFRALDVLGWTKGEFDAALGALTDTDQICEVLVEGDKAPSLISKSVIDISGL